MFDGNFASCVVNVNWALNYQSQNFLIEINGITECEFFRANRKHN
jgi:hypothetical protein